MYADMVQGRIDRPQDVKTPSQSITDALRQALDWAGGEDNGARETRMAERCVSD